MLIGTLGLNAERNYIMEIVQNCNNCNKPVKLKTSLAYEEQT